MTTRRSTGCTGTRSDAGSGTRDAPAAVLTRRLPADPSAAVHYRLALTAEERTRSRLRFTTEEGVAVRLGLARGTVLRDGDLLTDDDGAVRVRVHARPEPVLTARSADPRTLLRAAYHLGNRHVAVEIGDGCVRLAPDAVLAGMLRQLGLEVLEQMAPFEPEAGAYGGHSHAHGHPHSHPDGC